MTALDHVPVAAISARAERARIAMSLLALVGALFYLPAWLLAKAARGVARAAVWVGAACAEGWLDGWRVSTRNEAADG